MVDKGSIPIHKVNLSLHLQTSQMGPYYHDYDRVEAMNSYDFYSIPYIHNGIDK